MVPGMATDSRGLEPQRGAPARVQALDWIEPGDGESLPSYAERLAEGVEVGEGDLFIGGVSLGAMIALEMSHHVPARAVFVIGGARSSEDVADSLHMASRLARPAPAGLIRSLLPMFARWVQFDEGLSDEQRKLEKEMAQSLSVKLLKWQALVACSWKLTRAPRVPVHAIHGEHDGVIKRDLFEVAEVVKGGSHLINLTHPAEVNAFIAKHLRAHAAGGAEA